MLKSNEYIRRGKESCRWVELIKEAEKHPLE